MKGFTLLEMLLSVALIALIAGMGTPLYLSFANRNDLTIAAASLTNALWRAEVLSRAVAGDSAWGVQIATSSVTVFKGATFASRQSASDEVTPIAGSIMITGTSEYDLAKFSGYPPATATTTLTSVNNDVRTITINAKGTITY